MHYDKRGRPMKIACIPLGIFAFCLAVLTICRAASARSLQDASKAEAVIPVARLRSPSSTDLVVIDS